jgi:hypothetical protein
MRFDIIVACAAAGIASAPALTDFPPTPTADQPHQVLVTAYDYTFTVPDTLPAGPVSFRLENKGRMNHELVIFTARPGVSAKQMLAAATPEDRRALADPPVGVLFAPVARPTSAELTATLEPHRWYMVFCGIRDSLNMPPHFMLGMVDSIYVR